MPERLYLFTRFERFWHWSQAALIIALLFSGFAIHGSHALLDFRSAVVIHELAAWLLIALWLFAVFWHFTTGQWRQYIPTLENVGRVARYYALGIFSGAPHPYRITRRHKHNPLQRIAYLVVLAVINPLVWVSGLVYLFWGRLKPLVPDWLGLEQVAVTHTAAAFLMLLFLIVHIYLSTTGATPLAHFKAMISGWEDKH